MSRRLCLTPFGGLCNRLRALVTAIPLCCDRELHVYWPDGLDVGLENLFYSLLYTVSSSPFEPPSCGDLRRGDDEVHICTSEKFSHDTPALCAFVPRRSIQSRVTAFLARHLQAWPRIGVHVRINEASKETRRHSPLSWFIDRIPQLAAQYPTASWFLCTDDAPVSEELQSRFPFLVESEPPPRYNSRAGVEKGVVDLHIFGRTDYIVGSHWSSFSEMAGAYQAGHMTQWHGEDAVAGVRLPMKPRSEP